nr:immunoglobulin heavy chain junction region [Mus musculus]
CARRQLGRYFDVW